jgi:hypothetical protein
MKVFSNKNKQKFEGENGKKSRWWEEKQVCNYPSLKVTFFAVVVCGAKEKKKLNLKPMKK